MSGDAMRATLEAPPTPKVDIEQSPTALPSSPVPENLKFERTQPCRAALGCKDGAVDVARARFTITDNDAMPVELLRDGRGIYGVGVSDLSDYEAVAWLCGVEPEPYTFQRPPSALILRPDWFMDTKPHGAVLQKIGGGFRRGPFMRASEEKLRQFIHHEALNRAGLPWPPSCEPGPVSWGPRGGSRCKSG